MHVLDDGGEVLVIVHELCFEATGEDVAEAIMALVEALREAPVQLLHAP